MAERRLAITIKGGVSLGAYEAGVLTETLALIAHNNRQLATNPAAVPWYIDTFAGASAGSVTAAITARILVDNRPFMRESGGLLLQPEDLLRRLWVEEISLDALVSDPPVTTLLDSLAISNLAGKYFSQPPQVATRHPALRPDGSADIRLGLSLSALNPGQERTKTLNGDSLVYHEYARKADFLIRAAADQTLTFGARGTAPLNYNQPGDALEGQTAFKALVDTAITSAAFPLAFAPRGLARRDADVWQNRYFVDGGVYDNDPVGEMINIAHELDWDSHTGRDDTERRFLIVRTEPPPFDEPLNVTVPNPELLDIRAMKAATTLISQFLEESMNSGLRGIGEVNRKIFRRADVLSRIAKQFADLQATPGFDFGSLAGQLSAAVALLASVYNVSPRLKLLRDSYVDDLAPLSEALFSQVSALTAPAKRAFIEFGLLYDIAADLADKVPFEPIVIGPRERLEGGRLLSFGGFLLKEMREHDFAQGRADAYEAWEKISQVPGESFILRPQRTSPPPPFEWTADRKGRYEVELAKFQDRIKVVIENAARDQLPAFPVVDRIVSGVIASVAEILIQRFLKA